MKKLALAMAAACVFAVAVVVLHDLEAMQDAIVFDVAITKTCWDRHGYDFISRWSCRSALHQVGPMTIGLGCAFAKKKLDICTNLEKFSADVK